MMKLSPEQKYRIQVFHALNPDVSHQDLADLFEVSRTTITSCLHRDRLPAHLQTMGKGERRRWILEQDRLFNDMAEYAEELPF